MTVRDFTAIDAAVDLSLTEQSIAAWMLSKRTTLWGSTWTVTDEVGRKLAARWFREQMEEWVAWVDEEKKKEKGDG